MEGSMIVCFIGALLLSMGVVASGEEKSCGINNKECVESFDVTPYIHELKHWMKATKKESDHELLNESMGGAAAGSVALTVREAGALGVDGGKHLAVEGIAEGIAHTAGAGAAAGVISAAAPVFVGFLVAGATAYTLNQAFKLGKYTVKTLPHCKKMCLEQNGDRLAKIGSKYLEYTVSSIHKESDLKEIQGLLSDFPEENHKGRSHSSHKPRKSKIEYLVSRLSNSSDSNIDHAMQEAMNCIMGCPTGISRYFICQMISHISENSPVDVLMQFAQILSASSSPDFKIFHSNSILSKFLYVGKGKTHACLRSADESLKTKMSLLNRYYSGMTKPQEKARH